MRYLMICAAAVACPLFAAPVTAQLSAGPEEKGWVSQVSVTRLADEFSERPADATMSVAHPKPWAIFAQPTRLPEPFRSQTFVNDSFVLLDIDRAGKAAGCRPLRASPRPQLDTLACDLLMKPGYFSVSFVPTSESLAGRWVMGVRWETLDQKTHAARQASALRPMMQAAPPPAPLRTSTAVTQLPAGQRKALSGSLVASDYRNIADRKISNGGFLAQLTVDSKGIPTACTVTRSTGNVVVDRRTCDLLLERARYEVRFDSSGTAVADTVMQPVDVGWMLRSPGTRP